jgi:hypothetical protein
LSFCWLEALEGPPGALGADFEGSGGGLCSLGTGSLGNAVGVLNFIVKFEFNSNRV